MPKPGKNENQDQFIARCIPELVGEGREQGQAVAICYSMWNEHTGKKGMHSGHGGMYDDDEDNEDHNGKPKRRKPK